MNNRQLYYKLRREKEKLLNDQKDLEQQKKEFALEKKEQHFENRKAELFVEIQKRENQNKSLLHQIEKERLQLALDQQANRMIEIQAQYDATIQFFEQKMGIMQLIEKNKEILHKEQIQQLEFINEQEKRLQEQKKVQQRIIHETQLQNKEKEINQLIYHHTDKLRSLSQQINDLQFDKNYYRQEVQFHRQEQQKLEYYQKLIQTYHKIKEERLALMQENSIQKEQFINTDYQQQYEMVKQQTYEEMRQALSVPVGNWRELGQQYLDNRTS